MGFFAQFWKKGRRGGWGWTLLPCLVCLSISRPLPGEVGRSSFTGAAFANQEATLVLHNRPLARIDGQVISLIDVVKRMDLFLFDYDPNLRLSPVEQFHFYTDRWQGTLQDMIRDALILIDAEKQEVKVTPGEVREAFYERFAPHLVENLDRLGLSYEKGFALIEQELLVRRMLGMWVYSKAFMQVTPLNVRESYQQHVKTYRSKERYTYQVVSFKGEDGTLCEQLAQQVALFFERQTGIDLKMALAQIEAQAKEKGVEVNLSKQYASHDEELSELYLKALAPLEEGMLSSPITQHKGTRKIVRLFLLNEYSRDEVEPFEEVYDQIKAKLLNIEVTKQQTAYLAGIKKRLNYQTQDLREKIEDGYVPFELISS